MRRPGTLVRHPLAIAGTLITAISGVVFLALLTAALIGLFDNPYAGLVVFVAVPAVLILGMILVPVGMWLQRRKLSRHPETPNEWPVWDFGVARVRSAATSLPAPGSVMASAPIFSPRMAGSR